MYVREKRQKVKAVKEVYTYTKKGTSYGFCYSVIIGIKWNHPLDNNKSIMPI